MPNFGSPLTKDQKDKKVKQEVIPKHKYPISLATTKKIINDKNLILGKADMIWFNLYMENKVQGECLPKSFLTNDLPTEIYSVYGNPEAFLATIKKDFISNRQPGLMNMQINL